MGLKTYKGPKYEQTPGPGEYNTQDIIPTNMSAPGHLIGTGNRSNLGASSLPDPPTLYNVRKKLGGPTYR